ncbi:MAG: DUF192 domain-containing protein [Acetobacteraceae bacterium]
MIVTRDGRTLTFDVEMALTMQEQMTGLMFRTAMPPDSGMLFDWGSPRPSQMWMKNTLILPRHGVHQPGRHDPPDRREHRAAQPATIDSRGPVRATLAGGTTGSRTSACRRRSRAPMGPAGRAQAFGSNKNLSLI